MTHRDPYVYLAPDEVRCAPLECNRKLSCARYMALIGSAPVADLGRDVVGVIGGDCGKWVSAAQRLPARDAPAPRVHPPLGSMA